MEKYSRTTVHRYVFTAASLCVRVKVKVACNESSVCIDEVKFGLTFSYYLTYIMAIYRWTNIGLIIFMLMIALTRQEIHRAKANSPKSAAKLGKEKVDYLDAAAEVMQDLKLEVWVYSVIASILVGLSGIFPLLVIPMEAGPALKHGGNANSF